jgi:methionyl-tRNA formyltransferase
MDTERGKMSYYILAGCLDWTRHIDVSDDLRGGDYAQTPEALYEIIEDRGLPEFVFFPHWRRLVPGWLLDRVPCVGFHLGDLPHGRGGSPIQWRILEGKAEAIITAYRMTEIVDWGPVYCKEPLCLCGSLREIFKRAAPVIAHMIRQILAGCEPIPLEGDPSDYPARARRKPEASDIRGALESCCPRLVISDLIRMVDHPDYPRAFIRVGAYKLTFSNARLEDGRLTANVAFL